MSNRSLLTAIDYNAGLGGHSWVCSASGISVLAAKEDSVPQREIFQSIHPHIPLLLADQLFDIPQADLIIANLSLQNFGKEPQHHVYDNDEINFFYKLLFHYTPRAFLLRISSTLLLKKILPFVNDCISSCYSISYQVFREENYSGFPIKGNQVYLVGIRNDINHTFLYPSPQYSEVSRPPFRELPNRVNPWYRKLPKSLQFSVKLEENSYFYRGYRGSSHVSEQVPAGMVNNCFLMDALGIRRLTHEEYAKLKGYPDYPFNKWPNHFQMYLMLQRAPDLYVANAIVKSLCDFLNKGFDYQRPLKKKTTQKTSITNIEKPKETEQLSLFQSRNILRSLHIDKLKGLKNLEISFGKGLTAIMGVNGAGKSTILHALACMFSPANQGEDHKFNFFFTPTPDATWQGSSFTISYFDENLQSNVLRSYGKAADRWSPRYANRPKRDVFYLGIDTGLPEIEKERQTSFIDYLTDVDEDRLSSRVIATASDILRKDYQELTNHKTKKKAFFGIHTKSNITYSSLSMGAGEQRLIKILTTVYRAEPYSLILIDELELLLHSDAQKRFVKKLSELATKKNLQIIFTTHSLEIGKMSDIIHVQYLYNTSEKTMVYDRITPDIVFDVKRDVERPLTIYVEDDLAESVVLHIAKGLRLFRYVQIQNIGSAQNAFTLAAGLIIEKVSLNNRLVVLDGDVHRTQEAKIKQLEKVLSGTESDHYDKIHNALSVLTQFVLPDNISPEKFIHQLLLEVHAMDELIDCAKQIPCVSDNHNWLNDIVERMNQDRHIVLYQIVELVSESEKWGEYIDPIRNWLLEKQRLLGLT